MFPKWPKEMNHIKRVLAEESDVVSDDWTSSDSIALYIVQNAVVWMTDVLCKFKSLRKRSFTLMQEPLTQ